MIFSFSADDFAEKTKAAGMWGMGIKYRLKGTSGKESIKSSPRFRKNCLTGERMLLNQATRVVESGFIKTSIDYEELARDYYMSEDQVREVLNSYFELINGGWNYNGLFYDIDEFFSCFVTSDDVVDYHWNVIDRAHDFEAEKYAMSLMEATHLERKECFYFCVVMTKLAAGDFFLENSAVRLKHGYEGERYVQTVVDLSWFLAAKMLGMIDEVASPMGFFGETGDWWKYNRYPMTPAYITKVMETRKRLPGGVTTSRDVEDLFDEWYMYYADRLLLDGVIPRETYLDVKLLEWAAKLEASYGRYMDEC